MGGKRGSWFRFHEWNLAAGAGHSSARVVTFHDRAVAGVCLHAHGAGKESKMSQENILVNGATD